MTSSRARRAALSGIALAVLATVLVRVPLLRVPLDADEGGYAYLSRRWADGGRLYGAVWVDRPQGLLLAYRAITALGRSPVLIHLAAIGAAMVLVAAVAAAAWALSGVRAAVLSAALVAVAGSVPQLQGFMFNGELAATACSASALAVALWGRRMRRGWLLVLAGVLGALAVGMKQSGFDGLVLAVLIGWTATRVRGAAQVLAGALLPTGLALLHAALTSWSDWWFAVVGYRLDTSAGSRGGLSGRWHNIVVSAGHGRTELLPLAVLAVLGLLLCLPAGRRRVPQWWVPPAWFAVAAMGFGGGVFFFPHYWIQLVGPACLLGGVALAGLDLRVAAAAALVLSLPVLTWTARVAGDSADHRDRVAVPDSRLLANRDIAPWLRAHARPGDQLYAFVSSADLYYSTGLRTGFRYLWQANLEAIPSAVGQLRGYLAGPGRPAWVVLYQQPAAIDATGGLGRTLAADYRPAALIDGYQILHAR